MTTQLVRSHDIICMEDLSSKNMMKNHKLALHVADAAWGEIRRQLAYKADWYGKELVVIDRFFPSSQTCGWLRMPQQGGQRPQHPVLDLPAMRRIP